MEFKKLKWGLSSLILLTGIYQCSSNKITKTPLENHFDTITSIKLSENQLGSYPKEFYKYRNITKLDVSGLNIKEESLIKIINSYPHLEILILDNCNIQQLPKEIDSLINLKFVSLVNNKTLKKIPLSKNIKYLNIKGCSSIENYKSINNLHQLNYLNLSHTNISIDTIKSIQLENLITLNLSATNIEDINIESKMYPKLKELDIRQTPIDKIENIKKSFPKLKTLYTDNDFLKKNLENTKLIKPYF